MLGSLFADLGARQRAAGSAESDSGFAATAILEDPAEAEDRSRFVDRHLRDLFVSGEPAQALREHLAGSRAEVEGRRIVLLDPARSWAGAVLKALSDAGGQPIERLHLREQATLRTLAVIERTSIVRRPGEMLSICHADVRAGRGNADIPLALMERAHMTAVIVGPMQPHAIDAMLSTLWQAASRPAWRCPTLLFMLPPGAVWIASKIAGIAWPKAVQVQVRSESLSGAPAVWNAVLGIWDQVKEYRPWDEPKPPAAAGPSAVAMTPRPGTPRNGDDTAGPVALVPAGGARSAGAPSARPTALDAQRTSRALRDLLRSEGLLACAVADSASGLLLASEQRDGVSIDLDIVAAACARALRAQQLAGPAMGLLDPIEELTLGAGARQQVLRVLAKHPQRFIFTLLDRSRTNLALARLKLLEAEKTIG